MKLLHIVAKKAQFRIAHLVLLHNIFTYSPGEPRDSVNVWCYPWSQDTQQLTVAVSESSPYATSSAEKKTGVGDLRATNARL